MITRSSKEALELTRGDTVGGELSDASLRRAGIAMCGGPFIYGRKAIRESSLVDRLSRSTVPGTLSTSPGWFEAKRVPLRLICPSTILGSLYRSWCPDEDEGDEGVGESR